MVTKVAIGEKGVVSDHQLATQVGVEVLKDGGNAFDAAIAVSAVLSVVQPHMGGLGGDAFLLGFIGDDVVAYMSSGRSPKGFDVDAFLEKKPLRGPLTVTVPGLVHLWGHIHEEYATMPLERLLKPAIKLAYSGFHVGLSLARASKLNEEELAVYKWANYFKGLRLGDLYVNREMARALRLVASRSWEEFYYGELAENTVSELQDQGVDVGLDDLMEHGSYKVKPLKLEVDEMTLYELPPNTQGVSTLQLISALYELGLREEPFDSPSRIVKWSKPVADVYLFRDLYLGDPDYMSIDPQSHVKYSDISNLELEASSNENGTASDTTFFVVSDGEAILGFIQSLFSSFGSGLVISGFPVQNRAVGFAKKKGLPNSPAPEKLPLHTLSVLGVDRGNEKYIIGCVGGDLRPQLHLRVFENLFAYNMNVDEALSAPRFIYTTFYGSQKVIIEEPLRVPSRSELNNIVAEKANYFGLKGHVHVGKLSKGVLVLACDPRSEGVPLAT
ncbi:MAG: gamma-glutamyltransferase [Desulfurococcaceae archaeon]